MTHLRSLIVAALLPLGAAACVIEEAPADPGGEGGGRADPSASASAPAASGDDHGAAPGAVDSTLSGDEYLRSRRLMVPVAGVAPSDLSDGFLEQRGERVHHALDIMAPRGTAVIAADDGTVAKLHLSGGGGISLYQADPTGRFIYYYAHLDRYRDGVAEGSPLRKGEVLGYVGSTGNASADAPHLHFAIGVMGEGRRWWETVPIDPRPLLVLSGAAER